MAKQVDNTNIGTLLEALITKIKSFFWRKNETSELPIDNTPTSGSNNLVKSGGVYSSLQGIRQLKVINLGNFYPQGVEITLGTKAEAAAALNITEAQVDSLLNGEYDYIEFGSDFFLFGGYKISSASPYESVYMCLGIDSHFVTMPYCLEFWNRNNAGVYSYNYAPIGIKDVTVGGESVVDSSQGGVAVIPAIPDVSQFITRSVNDLANYYLKSETYTKDEVASLIGAIQQFHYEIAASTSAVTDPSNNVLYLIGPTGSGADKYEEYVYDATKPVAERWVKIGDTSIDLSGYVTTQALNTALAAYTTTNDLATLLAGKQDTIDAQHKLDYSLIANTPTFVDTAQQSLTDAQKSQARTNIGAGTYSKPANGIPASDLANGVIPTIHTEVFVVTYGTTTQSEILAAVAAGQLPVCKYGDNIYVYAGESSADYSQFTSILYDTAYRIYVKNSTWGSGSYEVYSKPSGGIPASDLAAGVIPTDIVKYTAQTLTDAQKAQARTNIGAKESEVFWAEYGVTTLAEIRAQVDAGKSVFLLYQNPQLLGIPQIYFLFINAPSAAAFYSFFGEGMFYIAVSDSNGTTTWSEPVNSWPELADNKVTSWQATPDNDHYPSEKLVKDSLDGKQPTIDANHKLDYSLVSNTPTVPTQYAGSPTAGGFANKAVAIPFGEVVEGSTETALLATVDNFPDTLTDGVCAYVRNNMVSSASGFTLNINGTGAKPVYQTLADAGRVTTVFNAASTYLFIYNSTRVEGGCWDLYYGYNSNDNTIGYNLRTNTMSLPTTSACYRYRLLFTSADGTHFVPANASTSTNATTKRTTAQTPIDPFGSIRYYSHTSAVSSGNRPGATYLWEQYSITLGYSFNRTGAALTLTAWKPVYIKCAPQTNGSAIIEAETPYVQDLPATADGKIYIFLGIATAATTVEMVFHHPVYYHDGTRVSIWPGPVIGDIQTALDAIIGKSLI